MRATDLKAWFDRYRPFVVLVVGILLVALVLPLRDRGNETSNSAVGVGQGSAPPDLGPAQDAATTTTAIPAGAPDPAATGAASAATGSRATRALSSSAARAGGLRPTGVVANCDPATGRIKLPTVYAPPCVDTYDGNAGATWQGVTAQKVKVAVYLPQLAAGAAAAFVAAGGDPNSINPDTQKQVYEGFRKFFMEHYETYGREVEFVYVQASGNNTDAQAAKADAIQVAETDKAFASIFGPTGALEYAKELAARGVLCIDCATGLPNEFFQAHQPYLWFMGAGWSVGALHIAEVIGKELWGRPARWAGTPDLQSQTRKWANIYFESPDQDYKAGADLLDRQLAKYGARMADTIPYPFDLSTAQSQARTIVARLKADGITTVLLATDWAYPLFFTQEATKQAYFPEWFAAGAATTNLFSRSYDQQQWSHAFGPNTAPVAPELTDTYRLWQWQYGTTVPATCCYNHLWPFFTGVHMAGPVLTPTTFRDGMFAYPPAGGRASGQVATSQIGFGRHGGFGFNDYTGMDDLDLAWWDPTAQGTDEAGTQGAGMWRHMDGARRYLPGEYPTGEPRFFDPAGTVTQFTTWPDHEQPPDYPPPGGH